MPVIPPAPPNRRAFWLRLHRWLGLVAGLPFVLAGLTGSLLVFYGTFDIWLNPELQIRAPAQVHWPLVLERLRQAEPDRTDAWRLEVPVSPDQPVTARYYSAADRSGAVFAPLLVSLHPVTGEVLTTRFWGDTLMTWIYDLHYTLLLGASGKQVMAVIGILLVATLAGGVVLWWPTLRKPALALALDFRPGAVRRNYHLHKAAGVYGGAILLVLALTGTWLAAPQWFNPVIESTAGSSKLPSPRSTPTTAVPVSVTVALQSALDRFPGARVRWIQTPAGEQGTWLFRLEQDAEPGQRFPKTMVWVDRYSGAVLATSDPLAAGGGDTLLNWMHPLHSGEAFGLPGRIIVALAGLLCPLLFLTGIRRWLQKRRARVRRGLSPGR